MKNKFKKRVYLEGVILWLIAAIFYGLDYLQHTAPSVLILPISNSIGMGCSIIEIHMHLKNNKYGFDHESAHNKSQFKRLVKMIRTIDNSFGNISDKSFSKVELKYRNFQKKSIVASKNLKKYHKLTEKDFLYLRKDKLGLQPFENSKILNRKLLYDVKKYDLILKKLCN